MSFDPDEATAKLPSVQRKDADCCCISVLQVAQSPLGQQQQGVNKQHQALVNIPKRNVATDTTPSPPDDL